VSKYISKLQFYDVYKDEDICLDILFKMRYGNVEKCPNPSCDKVFNYRRVKNRKCYQCTGCYNQIYPMKGTRFQDCKIRLDVWFKIIYDFHKCLNSVSCLELERDYELSHRTAVAAAKSVRTAMRCVLDRMKFTGTTKIEIDESWFGGRKKLNQKEDKKGIGDKPIVFGITERKGTLKMFYILNKDKKTMLPIIRDQVPQGSTIYTDAYTVYQSLPSMGYKHRIIEEKGATNFRRGINTNRIEGAWSRVKKCIEGTHNSVSREYLQPHLDEFSFRYSMRRKPDKGLSELLNEFIFPDS